MKVICDSKGWPYPTGARATDLLKIIRANGLLPDYLDQSFDQLVATLKSGLPVVRNETVGHGQGAKPVDVPQYIAEYALNLAASKIGCYARHSTPPKNKPWRERADNMSQPRRFPPPSTPEKVNIPVL